MKKRYLHPLARLENDVSCPRLKAEEAQAKRSLHGRCCTDHERVAGQIVEAICFARKIKSLCSLFTRDLMHYTKLSVISKWRLSGCIIPSNQPFWQQERVLQESL